MKQDAAGTTRRLGRARSLLMLAILLSALLNVGCVKRSHDLTTSAATSTSIKRTEATDRPTQRININIASADELEKLPGIGKGLAARIVEHREKYGPFRKPEHLIIVRGISDKRFRALQDLITIE